MKKIIILLLVIIPLSCGPAMQKRIKDKRCQKHFIKAIHGGCLDTNAKKTVDIDTTAPEIKKEGTINVMMDTSALFRLWKKDSCFSQSRIDTLWKYMKVKPIHLKDSVHSLDIWMENGVIKYKNWHTPCVSTNIYERGPTIKLPCDQECEKVWPYIVGMIALALICILLLIFLIVALSKLKRLG